MEDVHGDVPIEQLEEELLEQTKEPKDPIDEEFDAEYGEDSEE